MYADIKSFAPYGLSAPYGTTECVKLRAYHSVRDESLRIVGGLLSVGEMKCRTRDSKL